MWVFKRGEKLKNTIFFTIFALYIVYAIQSTNMKSFFNFIWEFIKRNPFLTLFIVLIAIAAPQVLGFFALLLLIPLALIIVVALVVAWRIHKLRKSVEDQVRNGQHTASGGGYRTSTAADAEGKVTVHVPRQEPRINDQVGEYVDFKEEK